MRSRPQPPIADRTARPEHDFVLLEPLLAIRFAASGQSPIKAFGSGDRPHYPRSRRGISRFYDREPACRVRACLDASGTPSLYVRGPLKTAISGAPTRRRVNSKGFAHVTPLRPDRKGGPGRPQGEPFEHQDQAAVPAEPAQRHADLRRARPLGQAAGFGQCAQDRRPPRRPRRLPAEGQGRRAVAQGARAQARRSSRSRPPRADATQTRSRGT